MTVFAFSCHPDDIEFMMAGTLLLLKKAGCTLHYMNLADGSLGSTVHDPTETARIRRGEAMRAAAFLGAAFHESLVPDLQVYYTDEVIRKVTAVIREVKPDVLLLQSPEDYMEDHMATCRIGATAAFCRGIPNYITIPPREPTLQEVALYHTLPYGLMDGLRRTIVPDFFVDISSVIDDKEKMLGMHESQKQWLDQTQGLDSYLKEMRDQSRKVGAMSGKLTYAEGFRRHSNLGYCGPDRDPLAELLKGYRAVARAGKGTGSPKGPRA
jgi:N-acetylglucosamine malate deacetylase 1